MPEDSYLTLDATIKPSTQPTSAVSTVRRPETAAIYTKTRDRLEAIGTDFQRADEEVKKLVGCLSAGDRSDVDLSDPGTIAESVWSKVKEGLFESVSLNFRLKGDLHASNHARKGWITSPMADLTWQQSRTWLESTDAKLNEDVLPEHDVRDIVRQLKKLVVYSQADTTQAASDDRAKPGEGSSSLLIRVLHDPQTQAEIQAREILRTKWDSARRTVDDMGLRHGDRNDAERIPLHPMAWLLYDSRLQDKAELERLIQESEQEEEDWPFNGAGNDEESGELQEK